jgi:hypothetical protein
MKGNPADGLSQAREGIMHLHAVPVGSGKPSQRQSQLGELLPSLAQPLHKIA